MPPTTDLQKSLSMTRAVNEAEAFKPKAFLTETFFDVSENVMGESLTVDIIKGARRLAPWVHPLSESKLVEKLPYRTDVITPGYVKIKKNFTVLDALKRKPGELIYQVKSPQQMSIEMLADELVSSTDDLARRIEHMSAEALLTGKVTIVGDGYDRLIDYSRSLSNEIVLTGADTWDTSTSDPIGDMFDWKNQIAEATGLMADTMVLGKEVLKAFLKNVEVKSQLDLINAKIGQILRQDLPQGAVYYGEIHGVNIYGYHEWYLDSLGVSKPMIPDKEIIFGVSKKNRPENRLHYCAIYDVEFGGLQAVPIFVKTWVEPEPSARILLVQSSPLCVLTRPDTIIHATVLP